MPNKFNVNLLKVSNFIYLSFQVLLVDPIIIVLLLSTKLNCERLLENEPITIVLSFSGLGQHYLNDRLMVTLRKMAQEGVTTMQGLTPVFPSSSPSNHHTFATGLYVENHGIVGESNSFYDYNSHKLYNTKDWYQKDPRIVPVWTLNEISGGHSGCLMWPGSEYTYMNRSCTYHVPFSPKTSLLDKARLIVKWILSKDKPANLVMVYSHMPANVSTFFGPESSEVGLQRMEIDKMLKHLLEHLGKWRIYNRLNFIILGDQAFMSLNNFKITRLKDVLDPKSYKSYGKSPVLQIVPGQNDHYVVHERLLAAQNRNKDFDFYVTHNFPKRWHTKRSLLSPMLLVAKPHACFDDGVDLINQANDIAPRDPHVGITGYDTDTVESNGLFIAKGVSFKKNTRILKVHAVDVFAIICHASKLGKIPPNNSTIFMEEVIRGVSMPIISIMIVVIIAGIIGAIIIICLFIPKDGRANLIIWKSE